jgi:pimeloyl-ACP methyl ester carboxylesterase
VKISAAPIAALALLVASFAPAAAGPVTLKTTEFGTGPAIVLVHGLGSGRMSWMPTARKLLAHHHVVMVDLPGHGDSPLPDPFSLEASAEALDQVITRFSAESTIVVGQGVGGLLALMTASAHPGHERGLILIDVALKSPVPIDDQQKQQFATFMDQNYDVFLKMTFGQMGRDSAQSVAIHAMASQVPPNTMKAYFRALLNVDGSRTLKDLKTPTLVVFTERLLKSASDWPAAGKTIGWDNAAEFTPRRIGNAGMMVASEQPDTLVSVITEFQPAVKK